MDTLHTSLLALAEHVDNGLSHILRGIARMPQPEAAESLLFILSIDNIGLIPLQQKLGELLTILEENPCPSNKR